MLAIKNVVQFSKHVILSILKVDITLTDFFE